GGRATQTYRIGVGQAAANQPPAIVSDPITQYAMPVGGTVVSPGRFVVGDVLVAVGGGKINRYSAHGDLQQVLVFPGFNSSTNFPDGMAFDADGNLYVAGGADNAVAKFDNHGTFLGTFGSGYAGPKSIVIDKSGNVYVGNVGGAGILKFDSAGNLLATI